MKLQSIAPWWLIVALICSVTIAIACYHLWQRRRSQVHTLTQYFLPLVVCLLVAYMALGPSVPGGTTPPGMLNLDVLFAVDTTASMGAEDYTSGNKLRIEGVRHDMLAVARKMQGARFSIVTFDSKAQIILPYTADASAFTSAVETMDREVFLQSKGSSIDAGYDALQKQLKNSQLAHPDRARLIFYLGDGEQTLPQSVRSFEPLSQYVKGGAVLGYGTAQGGKMLKYWGYSGADNSFDSPYITELNPTTFNFEPGISKLDEANLQKIAQQLHVSYQNRNDGGDIKPAFDVSKAATLADHSREITGYTNTYWIASIPLVIIMFRELIVMLDAIRQTRSSFVAKEQYRG